MTKHTRNIQSLIPVFTFALMITVLMAGCANESGTKSTDLSNNASSGSSEANVFISVVSDMDSNPQAVDMAMKLAGFSLDEKRDVFIFFNVKGVQVPVKTLGDDVAFADNDPIKKQLASLIERGAVVHVCPICMKALDVKEDQLVSGAKVTTRPKLFEQIRDDACVFTY